MLEQLTVLKNDMNFFYETYHGLLSDAAINAIGLAIDAVSDEIGSLREAV